MVCSCCLKCNFILANLPAHIKLVLIFIVTLFLITKQLGCLIYFIGYYQTYYYKTSSIIHALMEILNPLDTGRKLNVYKTFRRRPGR